MANNNCKDKKNDIDSKNIAFEVITDKYSWGLYGDFRVIIDNNNGYINATKLCKQGGKNISRWNETQHSKTIENEISNKLGIKIDDLKYTLKGGKNYITWGTYVHPALITSIANWCSVKFAANVSCWIEEWKSYSTNNELSYWKVFSECEPNTNDNKEKIIELKLQDKYGDQTQVKTICGDIDLLTDKRIIEIKYYKLWKHALGQILAYSYSYPNHDKVIYLFDLPDGEDISYIRSICDKFNVIVEVD